MYICLCKNITDKDINRAVCCGARSMKALRQELDVCGGCGKCGLATRDCLNKAVVAQTSSSAAAVPTSSLRSGLYANSHSQSVAA